jgi:type III pantothenate kinase
MHYDDTRDPMADTISGAQEKSALLAVDIGNTNISCGIFHGGNLKTSARYHSSVLRTADEYFSLMGPLLEGGKFQNITQIAVASVVPELTRIWQHLFQKYFSASVYNVSALSPLGITFKVADPSFIGADLVVNAFAAWKKHNRNCIIVDLGTATTVQFVTAKGIFEGTAIAPGLRTGAINLFEKAALLSGIELTAPPVLIGQNTRDALLSGIVQGHAFMVESFVKRIKTHYFDHPDIITILTGGIADLIRPLVPSADIVDKTLTLEGLCMAHAILAHKERG